MLSVYPAIFYKESSGYSVIFPDLNYLATCGNTLEEAMTMAIDCLAYHLFWLRQENKEFPVPSDVTKLSPSKLAEELEFDYDVKETFVNIVSVDVTEYSKTHFEKSIKKTLTIPAWLNNAALEQNINFSQVLQNALIDILGISVKSTH